MRGQQEGPVWRIGTSNGTISLANAAARLTRGGPDGIVLTSTVSLSGTSVHNTGLGAIRMPVLIVHHEPDLCAASPVSAARILVGKLKAASLLALLTLSGGSPPETGPCEPFSPHGYFGIGQKVVDAIAQWLISDAPPRALPPATPTPRP